MLNKSLKLALFFQVILGLEVLWPVVIFLVVVLVRLAVPPEDVPTCMYLLKILQRIEQRMTMLHIFWNSFITVRIDKEIILNVIVLVQAITVQDQCRAVVQWSSSKVLSAT